jgi:hypothetical protein
MSANANPGTILAATLLAICGLRTDVTGQLYPDPDAPVAPSRLVIWNDWPLSIPMIDAQGDELLSAWGHQLANPPGLALTRCSTGETLWTYTLESPGSLTAYLLPRRVLLFLGRESETAELVWLDRATGQPVQSQVVARDSNSTILTLQQTVLFAGRNEIFDLETGERLGELPQGFPYMSAREINGKLYASITRGPDGTVLHELDLKTLGTRRWNLQEQLQERGLSSWMGATLGDDEQLILQGAGGEHIMPGAELFADSRTLAQFDLATGQIRWHTVAPYQAPLLFVRDVDALTPEEQRLQDLVFRPLLIDWTSGELRMSDEHGRVATVNLWVFGNRAREQRTRELDDVIVFHQIPGGHELLVGVDLFGRPRWSRVEPTLSSLSRLGGNATRMQMTDRHAVVSRGASLEILDLRTGQVQHTLTAESVGLTAIRPNAAAIATAAAGVPTAPAEPHLEVWLDTPKMLFAAVLLALGAYLGLRRLLFASAAKSPIRTGD